MDYNVYDGRHENKTHCTMVILELGSLPHLPRNFSELVPKSHDLQKSFWVWRGGSTAESIGCSPRGSKFDSQSPQSGSQNHL